MFVALFLTRGMLGRALPGFTGRVDFRSERLGGDTMIWLCCLDSPRSGPRC